MTVTLDTPEMAAEVSAGRRMFVYVRAQAARQVGSFLKTPLAWVLVAAIAATTWWYSDIRQQNYRACAATSIVFDQRTYGEVINGTGGIPGGMQFYRACNTFVLPGANWAALGK